MRLIKTDVVLKSLEFRVKILKKMSLIKTDVVLKLDSVANLPCSVALNKNRCCIEILNILMHI